MIQIISYQWSYFEQLVEVVESLQDYLINIDPLKSLKRWQLYGVEYTKNMIEKTEKNGKIFLALSNEKVIGMSSGEILTQSSLELLWDSQKKTGRILELIVVWEERWTWVGSQLIKSLENFFLEQNCNWLSVECFTPNISAHTFYEKHGYTDRSIYMTKSVIT